MYACMSAMACVTIAPYYKCNFPICPHVRPLVCQFVCFMKLYTSREGQLALLSFDSSIMPFSFFSLRIPHYYTHSSGFILGILAH